jgi:hypothetical protein
MITNQQVRKLRRLEGNGVPKEVAAVRAGMDAKTARKYRRLGKLPSEVKPMDRDWRTHPDAFADVWPELEALLQVNPRLQAKTLFADLRRRFPGRFADGQLRTLQRRLKRWRAENGPAKEVFFAQVHHPGRLAASDFTHCTDLGVTINGSPFAHVMLPLRADVLELGNRDGLLLGEPGEPQRGLAERLVGTGRRAPVAPHGPADGGGAAGGGRA